MLGIESWKPVMAALVLPPVPFLVLILIGARLLLPRRGLGWLLILISVVLLWLSACSGAARGLGQLFLQPPAAMSFDRVRELRAETAPRQQQPRADEGEQKQGNGRQDEGREDRLPGLDAERDEEAVHENACCG